MRYDQFIETFAGEAGVSADEAEPLVLAGLQTLAERLTGGEARDLAAQLPKGLKPALEGAQEPAEGFGVDEFIRRLGDRAGVDPAAAERATRALFATLRKATVGGEFRDVLAQLPGEFRELAAPRP